MNDKHIIHKLESERNQLKQARDIFEKKLNDEINLIYKIEGQLNDMKKERNTLIDDVVVLRAKIKRLQKIEQNYKILTNHIRNKAEHNPNVARYIALVNFIDSLEIDKK